MATLWRRRLDDGATWEAQAVDGGDLSRAFSDAGPAAAGAPAGPAFALASFGKASDGGVAILAPLDAAVWINGAPLLGGLKVLGHRDEILVGGELFCYSAQSRPVVIEFTLAEGGRRPRCGVCRMEIEDGQAAVACPQCGRVYHQIDAAGEQAAKQCWTYLPTCLCGHSTALGEDGAWRPDQEGFDD